MATVYGIIRQNDGHIWVYSEPGSGTTFKIYFPMAGQTTQLVAAESSEVRTVHYASEIILLVEDSKLLARVARDFLVNEGYTVLMASSSQEAIDIASNFQAPIHLLLTDVVMPDMGGGQLAEVLLTKWPEMKVLYMSGYTNGILSEQAIRAENVAFIEKPFSQEALSRKVRQALEPDTSR